MAGRAWTTLICTGLGATTCACASMNDAGTAVASGGGAVYHTSSTVVVTTVGETYNGLGGAMRRPFQDFNLMQESIPDALQQAVKNPYDTNRLSSCDKINQQVAALDVVLGPDLDTPKEETQRDRWQRGASSAADAAVAAATGAADHFIPVRGVIRQLSGAVKTEKQQRQALLAGSVRRGFLKAVGMQQGCGWPAAPVDFHPEPIHRQHVDGSSVPEAPSIATDARPLAAPALGATVIASGLSPIQAAATPVARPADYARVEAAIESRSVAAPTPAQPRPSPVAVTQGASVALAQNSRFASSNALTPAQASPPLDPSPNAAGMVHVADRAPTARTIGRRGVVERAPVGQSVVLPPRAGESRTSSAADVLATKRTRPLELAANDAR